MLKHFIILFHTIFVWWEVWLPLNRLKTMTWQLSTTSVRDEHLCLDWGADWGKLLINLLLLLSPGPEHQVTLTLHMCGPYCRDTPSLILPLVLSLTCGGHLGLVQQRPSIVPPQNPTAGSVPLCIAELPQLWSRAVSHHWLLLLPGCTAVGPSVVSP